MRKILILVMMLNGLSTFAGTVVVVNTNDSGAGSLRAAISSSSSGDTIRFSPVLISGGSNTITLSSTILCNKTVVFKGLYNSSDTLFISAPVTQKVLEFDLTSSSSKNLYLDSLCIINAGGVIDFKGDSLNISHSLFRGHKSSVIYSFSDFINIVTISNTKVVDNIDSTNTLGIIAAINVISGSVTSNCNINIEDSEIKGNLSKGNGTIYCYAFFGNPHSKVKIMNCNISNNISLNGASVARVQTHGLTMDTNTNLASIDIRFSKINNNNGAYTINTYSLSNLAASYGRGKTFVSYSSFYNNNSSYGAGVIECAMVDIANSTFYQNNGGKSGVIYSNGGYRDFSVYPASDVTINNSTFVDNSYSDITGAGVISSPKKGTPPIGFQNIKSSSSLFYKNGVIQIKYDNAPMLNSLGYNVFSDSIMGGALSSDQLNVDSTMLKLDIFKNNGGNTKTIIPLLGSVAIDNGNPLDNSDAQNRPLKGRRDVGAAEYNCQIIVDSIKHICGNTFSWRGLQINSSGNYDDVILSSTGCDSIFNLYVKPFDNSSNIIYPYLTATMNQAQYQWLDCFNSFSPILGETGQWFTVTSNGSYAVEITKDGCIDTSSCHIISSVSLNENVWNNIKLFPNPNDGNFILNLGVQIDLKKIFITDINGRIITEITPQNVSRYKISFEGALGVYFLNIISEKSSKTLKVIKN